MMFKPILCFLVACHHHSPGSPWSMSWKFMSLSSPHHILQSVNMLQKQHLETWNPKLGRFSIRWRTVEVELGLWLRWCFWGSMVVNRHLPPCWHLKWALWACHLRRWVMCLVKDWWRDVEGDNKTQLAKWPGPNHLRLTFERATYPSQKGHQELRRYTFKCHM